MEKNYDPADFCGVLCDFAEDIINHQKARIEQLTQVAERQTSLAIERHFEIKRLKAEIERLKTVKKHIDTLIHKGIEYPTAETYEEAFYRALERLYDNANAKAEAIKEFAERLKEKMFNGVTIAGERILSIHPKGIDNLLKEMVGDK